MTSNEKNIRLDAAAAPVMNYCMHRSGAAAVHSVTIENSAPDPIRDARLEITASPPFILPFTQDIGTIPAGQTMTIARPKLVLKGETLAGLTERVGGILEIRLKAGEETLAERFVETDILAFDQWHGSGIYPELLASFVTPNHPQIPRIVARATEFLGLWTGDTSMDAYQSQNHNRVLSQAAAIFAAIKELGIAYAVAPASFEETGQRVRMCDSLLGNQIGNCLDLSLLYAACLEAVGLHPLLILSPGHIFAGLWLENQMFPECIQDDVSLITKRLAAGVHEIAVVETTAVTSGQDRTFDDARSMGELNLTTQRVEYILDIHRARMSRILPLPQRIPTDMGWEIREEDLLREDCPAAPARMDGVIPIDSGDEEENLPRKVQWERKLLDLGMRNTLINLRMTKTQLPILSGSLDELENALADGGDFKILPKPADWHMEDFTFEALAKLGSAGIIQAEFENKRLRTVLTEGELSKAVLGLYRTARTALEENGANTLYLALGMLRWFESSRSTKSRFAPIILLPIELVRKSAAKGFVIRMRDEEAQMNVTLLEKLKQDFGVSVKGLDPLPGDDHGIDIRKVFTIMRKAVMDQPRWDVVEAASIGIFSFSQFVMWNDIRNRTEDLLGNKIVRSLMEGKLTWDAQPLEMGECVNEDDVLLPMPADASQLFAIQTACNEESFVLHGPPGTGKSQTITSLIANALAGGRTVLFVAEKMAALEVVQKRLESIGIGPFCLELHSNKSPKKDVLRQLRLATEVTKTRTAEEFAARAEQLSEMRRELDGYAHQLHEILPCGWDLYTLISEYEKEKDAPELLPFDEDFIRSLTKAELDRQHMAVERLVASAREIGYPREHPLERVGCRRYSQTLRNSLIPAGRAYLEELEGITPYAIRLAQTLGKKIPANAEDLTALAHTAGSMVCWYEMPAAWARTTFPELYFEEVGKLAAHASIANALEARLLEVFEPGFLELDGTSLHTEFAEVSDKWILPKMMGTNRLYKTICSFAKGELNKDDLGTHIENLRTFQYENRAAQELLGKYGSDLGGFYAGKNTDWDRIACLAAQALDASRKIVQEEGSYELMHRHCGDPDLRDAVMALGSGLGAFEEARSRFTELLSLIPCKCENWLEDQRDVCQRIMEHSHELKEWIAYMGAAEEVRAMGLANVARCYQDGVDHDRILSAYRKAALRGLILDAIGENDTLDHFSGAVFNKKIEQYIRMDKEWTRLSQEEIYCRLAAKVPNFTREAAQSSELGILQRNIKSGGRGVSIRRLFEQIPNLLPRLCPCMLMSPISAAQYLDPKREPFDIVVFDEASQLPTCKAVGVLARGRDAVIVGDPKQMPPTAFFATNTVDEDNLETEDLESILDDCLALNMPQSHLLWHYRSRHESLIAFSNSQFYDNQLLTFPSVNDRESKVRLVHVDGFFDRGKTRTNRAEAQAVVEEICRRCRDPKLSRQSLGVVTFNISQQHLIDDLLTEAFARDPELEKWAYGREEPLFIKNLENVQGDERDVILFSIGFGPDEQGKITMNFGPLNRDGGWRRLNVAVSRARCEMMVFATMTPDQLDLNRTKAEGVAALRSFLEYAQGRPMALNEVCAGGKQTNGIAAAICKALKKAGYDTDLSVGRSQYRIDIGVVDPRDPEQYILGIMLDGEGYGSARTTRDREIAQISVLEGLGWRIHRVWSMDWWDNSKKELKRILAKLQELESSRETPAEEIPAEPEPEKPQIPVEAPVIRSAPVYAATVIKGRTLTPEEFVDPQYQWCIRTAVDQVISQEAPISHSLLAKRVVQGCGIARSGSRIQNRLNEILREMGVLYTMQDDVPFYWRDDQDSREYLLFRTNGAGESKRDIRDIPVQEICNAICAVLSEQVSMSHDDLIRESAGKFGYTRLGTNVVNIVELGIRYAEIQGYITTGSNDAWILTEDGTARGEAVIRSFQ